MRRVALLLVVIAAPALAVHGPAPVPAPAGAKTKAKTKRKAVPRQCRKAVYRRHHPKRCRVKPKVKPKPKPAPTTPVFTGGAPTATAPVVAPPASSPPGSGGTPPSGTPPPLPRRLAVDEGEYWLSPSHDPVAAGQVTFYANNFGQDAHDLTIEAGTTQYGQVAVPAGGHATLVATLPAGTYRLYCSLFDREHDQLGMNATLVVQ